MYLEGGGHFLTIYLFYIIKCLLCIMQASVLSSDYIERQNIILGLQKLVFIRGKLCEKHNEDHVRLFTLKIVSINGLNIIEFLIKIPVRLLVFRKLMRPFFKKINK